MTAILTSCKTYDQEVVYFAIKKAVDELGGISNFVKLRQKVLLKPNVLAEFKPENAATTHPEIIRAVIRLVREAGGNPSIGESPGFGSLEKFSKPTGIKQISIEENVPLVEFVTPREVPFPEGKCFMNFTLADEIFQFDVIINLPKFKTHVLTEITGAVKNLFGCVPGLVKSQYHFKIKKRDIFIEMIKDLARLVKPKLSIMDAVWAMEGEGPASGTPRNLGIIGVSSDPFELDDAFIRVINGENVQGFSCPDFKKVGRRPESVYHLPFPFLEKYLNDLFSEKPVINKTKCVNCNVCVKVCAPHALSSSKKNPVFDYDKCIRCFCCQEMCPERAIFVKRNKIADYIARLLNKF